MDIGRQHYVYDTSSLLLLLLTHCLGQFMILLMQHMSINTKNTVLKGCCGMLHLVIILAIQQVCNAACKIEPVNGLVSIPILDIY